MTTQPQDDQTPEFLIQRIYTKDLSFETPNTPHIFQEEWQPEMNVDLQTQATKLQEGVHEVILTVTVTVKSNEKVAFLIEVKEAGIFTVKNFPTDQIHPLLGQICPGIIYPYVREVISDVVVRGGFPQLLLAPINFQAMYQQEMEKRAKDTAPNDKAKEAYQDNVDEDEKVH